MNRKELKKKLDELGIRESIYSLFGAEDPGTILRHNIFSKTKRWEIYNIDERGNHYVLGVFDTEDKACNYFYQRMIKFKWVMDNAHIHPDDKPKWEDIVGFEVTEDNKVRAILRQ